MTPNQASGKSNEKNSFSNLRGDRVKQQPKYKLGQIVRTAGIKRTLSKGDSTNWSYKLYTRNGIFFDTTPTYRINYLPERYIKNFLLPSKLSLDESNQVMKKLFLFE